MQQQTKRFEAEILMDEVVSVDLGCPPSRSTPVVVNTRLEPSSSGTSARRLGVSGDTEFTGRGVSFCAACDGFFYRGQRVVVVGGGNAAAKEALFPTRFASRVHTDHRGDTLRADEVI